ncbi:MAG: NAD(P)H-dependent flavin oxidoreductase [Gammaproteobacteria bacterium]
MPIVTAFTEAFGLRHPIALAPMGAVAGGALAAAVSNAGALGLVGGGYGDPDWMRRELALVRTHARGPWGVGFITWSLRADVLALALDAGPAAVMLSFGDPRPWAASVRAGGCRLICQVQDRTGAEQAARAGADFIVAQGTEAGGHGGGRSLLPLACAVSRWVEPIPILAAGGIADGRGLAAALALGAAGALIGTRFYASAEALGPDAAKRRLVEGSGDRTVRTRVFDIVRGYDWPGGYTGRALRNEFTGRWHGSEDALAEALPQAGEAFRRAQAAGDCDTAMVWAGEGVDGIDSVAPAGDLVGAIAAQAEAALMGAAHRVRNRP